MAERVADSTLVRTLDQLTVDELLSLTMKRATKRKPMDHSPEDRLWAIFITELTKLIALENYFKIDQPQS